MYIPSVEHPTDRPNFYIINTDQGVFWYSYKTCIAFRTVDTGLVIRENAWSSTTGKHLNEINRDHSIRIPGVEFEERLAAL